METNEEARPRGGRNTRELPVIEDSTQLYDFRGYDADDLMKETSKLRKLITKKGTLEILIPLAALQIRLDILNSEIP